MPKATFRLSREAQVALDEIWLSIAVNSFGVERADSVLAKFQDALERIGDEPGIGHLREDLTDKHLLFYSVFSYLIIYDPVADPIQVLAILHGARNLGRHMPLLGDAF